MKDYYAQYEELGRQMNVRTDCVIPESLSNNYTPYEALGYTILFLFCVILITALIMMAANLLKLKMIGLLLNILLMIIGAVLNTVYHPFSKWFPVGNLMLIHQNKASYILGYPKHPIWYFAILIGVLLVVNYILVRKCNVEKDGEK